MSSLRNNVRGKRFCRKLRDHLVENDQQKTDVRVLLAELDQSRRLSGPGKSDDFDASGIGDVDFLKDDSVLFGRQVQIWSGLTARVGILQKK